MKIFFSVGEPSGDLHGANLIREMSQRDPTIQFVGFGGPRMDRAGCELLFDLTSLAVMWIARVLWNIRTFFKLLKQADEYFEQHKPDAVVLIDYPGFNWWVARKAKKHGIPVFYYGVPQMWAWAGWRIKKMRRLVDHALCKLPFEEKWYNDRGCKATFVGHPYYDEMETQQLDVDFVNEQEQGERLVTILPGSTTQEFVNNIDWLIETAEKVYRDCPDTKFAIASFNEKQAALAQEALEGKELPINVFVGRTPELIKAAHCCMACSGSVSLELLHHRKPTVILYRVSRLFYYVASNFVATVKYITLVNLLADDDPFTSKPVVYDPKAPGADQVPFPEYPTWENKSDQLATHLVQWLTDEDEYARRVALLTDLKQRFGASGASRRAAQYILDRLVLAESDSRKAA
jgi:lipid-A-disaccharide synthase